MTEPHTSGAFYWEAGSDDCPHGPEPDDDMTPEWDAWYERHTGSPQDVRICLDAPAGDACLVCSDEHGEMVPWEHCRVRDRRRPKDGVTPNPDAEHQTVTVLVGSLDCLERECEDYFDEDGNEKTSTEHCPHIREEQVCSCQRGPDGEYGGTPCPASVPA